MIRLSHTIAPLIIASFFILTLCSAGLLMAHTHGAMHAVMCPFTSTVQLSHLATIVGTAQNSLALTILVLVFTLALIISYATTPTTYSTVQRLFIHAPPNLFLKPLQLAFSQGILNPKVY